LSFRSLSTPVAAGDADTWQSTVKSRESDAVPG
jgi:hypothetical protein